MSRLVLLFFILLMAININAQEVDLDKGLNYHLNFNENLDDITVSFQSGKLSGAIYETDRFGNCAYALGFNNYEDLAVLDHQAANGLLDFSVSIWFKFEGEGQGNFLSIANNRRDNEINFNILSDGRLTSNVRNEANVRGIRIESVSRVNDGEWHHAVLTRTESSGEVTLFIDNVKELSKEMPKGIIEVGEGGFVFGNDQDCLAGCFDSNQQFVGKIDDFRLYRRVIADAEVAALFDYSDGIIDESIRGSYNELTACDDQLELSINRDFDSFQWNTGSISQTIEVRSSGLYIVRGRIRECDYADTTKVKLSNRSVMEIVSDAKDLLCKETIQLVASDGFDSYLWQDGSTNNTLTVNEPGFYWVRGENACGTSQSITLEVIKSNPNILEIRAEQPDIACGESFELRALGGFSNYEWSTGETSQSIRVSSAGVYEVRAVDQCGIEQTVITEIPTGERSSYFVPSAFTPNGDGKNEFFEIDDRLLGSKLIVVNRWGKTVYSSDSYMNDWSATNLPSSSYFVLIEGPCLDKSLKGWIKVIR